MWILCYLLRWVFMAWTQPCTSCTNVCIPHTHWLGLSESALSLYCRNTSIFSFDLLNPHENLRIWVTPTRKWRVFLGPFQLNCAAVHQRCGSDPCADRMQPSKDLGVLRTLDWQQLYLCWEGLKALVKQNLTSCFQLLRHAMKNGKIMTKTVKCHRQCNTPSFTLF